MGHLRVGARAELAIDRHERDQPVLEPRPLVGVGDARQQLEPLIHLQRVGRDGDRALAAGAQALGEGHGDGGLADAGRPEQRDHS